MKKLTSTIAAFALQCKQTHGPVRHATTGMSNVRLSVGELAMPAMVSLSRGENQGFTSPPFALLAAVPKKFVNTITN